MIKNEIYITQLNEIENQRGKLAEEEYLILTSWEKDLKSWMETHADVDGCTYIKIGENFFYCIHDITSTIMRVGGGFGRDCKGVLGSLFLKGFAFHTDKKYILDTFRTETRIDIYTKFIEISKDDFFRELSRVKNRLFALNDENIMLQYNQYPYYLDRMIIEYPEYLGDDNVKNMLNELELEEEKEGNDFEF